MAILAGGKPGTWHAGLVPGASAPFRVQFDAHGEAQIGPTEAAYLRSIPGLYTIIEDDGDGFLVDEIPDTAPEPEETPAPEKKSEPKRTTRRKTSLE